MRRTDFNDVQHLDWRTFISMHPKEDAKPGDFEQAVTTLDKYFASFAALPDPVEKDGKKTFAGDLPCIGCGEPLTGMMGRFVWGIAHGEGHCAICHWPGRANHYVKHESGEPLFNLTNFVLQYHPEEINIDRWMAGQPAVEGDE